jgi:hypothetical protein
MRAASAVTTQKSCIVPSRATCQGLSASRGKGDEDNGIPTIIMYTQNFSPRISGFHGPDSARFRHQPRNSMDRTKKVHRLGRHRMREGHSGPCVGRRFCCNIRIVYPWVSGGGRLVFPSVRCLPDGKDARSPKPLSTSGLQVYGLPEPFSPPNNVNGKFIQIGDARFHFKRNSPQSHHFLERRRCPALSSEPQTDGEPAPLDRFHHGLRRRRQRRRGRSFLQIKHDSPASPRFSDRGDRRLPDSGDADYQGALGWGAVFRAFSISGFEIRATCIAPGRLQVRTRKGTSSGFRP